MKLLTIDAPRIGRPGVLHGDDEVIDLHGVGLARGVASWLPDTVRDILDAGADGHELVHRRVSASATGCGKSARSARSPVRP